MAIQVDLSQSQYGVPFSGAYFRILVSSIVRGRNKDCRFMVSMDVAGYATIPQNDDTYSIESRRYYAPLDEVEAQSGGTFLAKCYSWVMAQPDMAGSVVV